MRRQVSRTALIVLVAALFALSLPLPAAALTMADLGTLGGAAGDSYATGINDAGQVVGKSITPSVGTHAFLWDSLIGMQDLGTLSDLYDFSYAAGINSAGQVVGSSKTPTGETHAFMWDSVTGMRDLGTLGGGFSEGLGINSWGQVVGSSYTPPSSATPSCGTPPPGSRT
jgi:probable HAF family extracellular repeat protein